MVVSLANEVLSDTESMLNDSQDSFTKLEKAFANLRLTMNALHLMKHTDLYNSSTYVQL